MKKAQIAYVANILSEVGKIPQLELTLEKIAAIFADRLEKRYAANFNRGEFLQTAGVSARLAQEVEAPKAATPPTTPSGHPRPFAPRREWAGYEGFGIRPAQR